jgi:hypothetical protein
MQPAQWETADGVPVCGYVCQDNLHHPIPAETGPGPTRIGEFGRIAFYYKSGKVPKVNDGKRFGYLEDEYTEYKKAVEHATTNNVIVTMMFSSVDHLIFPGIHADDLPQQMQVVYNSSNDIAARIAVRDRPRGGNFHVEVHPIMTGECVVCGAKSEFTSGVGGAELCEIPAHDKWHWENKNVTRRLAKIGDMVFYYAGYFPQDTSRYYGNDGQNKVLGFAAIRSGYVDAINQGRPATVIFLDGTKHIVHPGINDYEQFLNEIRDQSKTINMMARERARSTEATAYHVVVVHEAE